MIKLPIHQWGDSPDNFLYVNPEHISAYQAKDGDSSWLWLIHDESNKYEVSLPVDDLEHAIHSASKSEMVDVRFAGNFAHLQKLETLFEIYSQISAIAGQLQAIANGNASWMPIWFGMAFALLVTLVVIAVRLK
jgi:hypothetical protein